MNETRTGSVERNRIIFSLFDTPLGRMNAGVLDDRICLLEYDMPERLGKEMNELKKVFKADIREGSHPRLDELKQQLSEYFDGIRKEFNLPLLITGSHFQERVWNALQKIPYGTTSTYKQLAVSLGDQGAVRAVGRANGTNRLAILIPCHRVIGENGKLAGYGGGLWRKRWLLELERHNSPAPRGYLFA